MPVNDVLADKKLRDDEQRAADENKRKEDEQKAQAEGKNQPQEGQRPSRQPTGQESGPFGGMSSDVELSEEEKKRLQADQAASNKQAEEQLKKDQQKDKQSAYPIPGQKK